MAAGRSILRLETDIHQVAALRFYARCGFCACPIFPTYDAKPTAAVAASVFLERDLNRTPGQR